eukprot:TRINITY_DN1900_c1_g1_i1.p1 TRINITY_DN1900_c1_g1~~TRINITY_DN1900_c1_g1_i1.p1  ORF type:complete len:1690 (-),score=189.26 TRINITY_DN1900_c1_g1_i1:61-5130(-)
MRLLALVLIVLVALCVLPLGNGQSVSTTGALILYSTVTQSIYPLMQRWMDDYTFATDFVLISQSIAPNDDPIAALLDDADSNYDFAYIDSSHIPSLLAHNIGAGLFPIAGYAVVLPYRLDAAANQSLILSMSALAQIYLGTIRNWNDPILVVLNPLLRLPNIPIRPVVYSEPDSATFIISQALSQISTQWNTTVGVANILSFPIDRRNTTIYTHPTPSTFMNTLQSVDGTLGFAVSGVLNGYSYTQALFNRNQNIVEASVTTITLALQSFDEAVKASPTLSAPVVNSPNLQGWPLCGMFYGVTATSDLIADSNCEILSSVSSFSTWNLYNHAAINVAISLGYAPLTTAITTQSVNSGYAISCGGEPIISSVYISGLGLTSLGSVVQGWARVYGTSSVGSELHVYFQTASGDVASNSLFAGDILFAAASEIFSEADYDIAPDLLQFPVYAYGLAIAVNIPELNAAGVQVIVNTDIIAQIFSGVIRYWDDARIMALNPVSLEGLMPHKLITIVALSDSSSTTYVFTETLSVMSPQYYTGGATDLRSWPIPQTRIIYAESTNAASIMVNTSWSIGYITMPDIKGTPCKPALVTNLQGNAVGPYAANVAPAIEEFGVRRYNPLITGRDTPPVGSSLVNSLVAGSGNSTYPFSSYGYFVIRKTGHDSACSLLSHFLDFVVWSQTYLTAGNLLNSLSGAPTTPAIRTQVLEALATIQCNGDAAFAIAGCLQKGIICSGHGSCVNGGCLCQPEYTGTFCEGQGSTGDNSTIFLAVFLTVIPLIICCLVVLAIAIVALLILRPREKPWAVDFAEIELKQQIGAGGYGAVHKAIWKDSDVAVKLLANSMHLSREVKKNFTDEVKIMTQLRHPNVILFMGACTKPPNLCIIMEYMELGSLYDVLHNELVPALPIGLKIKLSAQAAQGMHFLHSSGILHRDLKSPNILLDEKWNAKISDFGLTKFKQESGSDYDRFAGSLLWTAPEVLSEEQPFAEPADVYSFGIILWELLTRKDPYNGMNPTSVAVSVLRDDLRPKLPSDTTACADFVDLIRNCWDKSVEVRPTFLEVVTRLKSMASSTSSDGTSRRRGSDPDSLGMSMDEFGETNSLFSSDESSKGNVGQLTTIDRAVQAPAGEMVIVMTDIHRAGTLWEFDSNVMRDATILHNNVMRATIKETNGYEVKRQQQATAASGEGSFCVVFKDVIDAVQWVIIAQERLMVAPWDEKLLSHPAAVEEFAGADDDTVYRGLRVKMGMHIGTPRALRDPLTRRIDYAGACMNKTYKLTALAQGGQILCSTSLHKVMKRLDHPVFQQVKFTSYDVGTQTAEPKVYELKPNSLAGRFFGGVVVKGLKKQEGGPDSVSMRKFQSLASSMNESDKSQQSSRVYDESRDIPDYISNANLCRWVIDFKDVVTGNQVGMGSYGMVYKAMWKGVDVAVKRLIKQQLSERDMLDFRAEVAFLSEMHHPNIVLFIGASMQQPNLCILTEYVKQGSLQDVLAKKSTKLPWQVRMKIAKGAALGIYYLHSLTPIILHRDLKSSNILIDENFNAKVADFGFARIKQDNATMTRCGSPSWTAPEVITGQKYTEKADVYSFGIILWEILSRQQPYKGLNYMNVGLEVVRGTRPKMPSNSPKRFARLITRCWRGDPDRRPAMEKVVAFFDKEEAAEASSELTLSAEAAAGGHYVGSGGTPRYQSSEISLV